MITLEKRYKLIPGTMKWQFLLLFLGLFLGYQIRPLFNTTNTRNSSQKSKIEKSIRLSQLTDELSSTSSFIEEQYESTLRSCLGPKCFNHMYKDEASHKDINRIGFLSFPGSGGDAIFTLISSMLSKHSDNGMIHLINDTHVPAYGYGRNHGWSSIIRFARRPIHNSYYLLKDQGGVNARNMDLQVTEYLYAMHA